MIHPDIAIAVAEAKQRDLRKAAAQSRLERLARCCRPSFLLGRAHAIRARWAERATHGDQAATCCA